MILADVAQHNAKVIFAGSDIIFFLRFKYIYALYMRLYYRQCIIVGVRDIEYALRDIELDSRKYVRLICEKNRV